MKINTGRYTSVIDKPFVLFIIGMRINAFWKIWFWPVIFLAMASMIRNLSIHREKGLLHYEVFIYLGGFGVIQYWRSFDELHKFANNPKDEHVKSRRNYYARNSQDVGIWHETYLIDPKDVESIYINTPTLGLGKAFKLTKVTGQTDTAKQRLKKRLSYLVHSKN
ncbi:hypothetical protein A2631_04760 [Candidatus Daviesbacteria bacterium RIFCSPHIGHO2_01_FULL_44_29]|uniref:DUF4188 domain-containing protein n=1 Tax=Candidatus Daviesbacteria bacterium RIFCSPHIGHO2_02_FULL_43_12 TaxID=1797776 RepID=A0A1F5KGH6_9BACT|nr:MAG: hypothetical protein A2631_04760 [Candidatus Daviesbacteria bacterium RIFCSPHIGHO2_01_FULL_44_29]OGE40032.1 MAG: hypothetical protein A3D25_04490 [Candidatus Daviesbacteria bacterium RIFCSPHIGHO2_02_FULL_43_12]OGE41486.1 MAG: hypothetical protein A3E86_05320 [Candidatus Daviesbacteria bacterium RIFCSPHIGHO2_12_FULL_47_45]